MTVTTVVIADDQEMIRVGLKVMLDTRGIEVVGEGRDGREALAVVRRHRPDVVLMDVRMPVLDGIAATEAIVTEGLSSKVLIVTTYDLDELVYRAMRSGRLASFSRARRPARSGSRAGGGRGVPVVAGADPAAD